MTRHSSGKVAIVSQIRIEYEAVNALFAIFAAAITLVLAAPEKGLSGSDILGALLLPVVVEREKGKLVGRGSSRGSFLERLGGRCGR